MNNQLDDNEKNDHNFAKIFVVDDEPNNFDTIEILLASQPYKLAYISSGISLLKRLNKSRPDVILLDVMMPELDGIEVCQQIKNNPSWRYIPIAMVTSLPSKVVMAKSLEAGADDFISKPINGFELRARVRSLVRIKQQYDALQAALTLREEMASMIVHDLRNPLTTIVLACESLHLTPLDDKQVKKVIQISHAGRQLQIMIDSLLLMAKLESGKMHLQRVETDLVKMGKQVIKDFDAIAEKRAIQLIGDWPKCELMIWADANLLRRVLDNLLSNALKFSPKESCITLQIDHCDPTHVTLRVIDEGKGIKAELRQQVFEKFDVGESMQGISQIGLGLAFCKIAITAHNGSIWIEDNQPTGAIFVIELPLDAQSANER